MDTAGIEHHPQLFIYIRTIIGMVLGLSLARLLSGLAKFVQHPHREKIYWTHIVWVAFLFLTVISFWWWESELIRVTEWTFLSYAFLIFYASLFYFLCVLLFPDDLQDYSGYREYFLSRRHWFFRLLALVFAVDFVDSALKGWDYFAELGPEYPVRNLTMIIICLIAARVAAPRFHWLFAVVAVLAQAGWIAWQYAVPWN